MKLCFCWEVDPSTAPACCPNFFSKNDCEFEPVVFAYPKPYELKKMVEKFFMDFSYFLNRFFKENLLILFSHRPDALGL